MGITTKKLQYNLAQLFFIVNRKLITILEWGRGTGKSTIIGRHISDCVSQMPRSSGALVAETYAQILTRTLPSTIAGLEQHGLFKDIHYFVGRRPPKSWDWPEPYEPPLDYKRCIIFWNGTVLNFISQDHSSSGRGLNIDWIVGDEAARLNKKKFDTDVLLTNRGNKKRIAHYPDGSWKYFEDCSLHHSILLASSTPVTADGMWILDFEQQALLNPSKYLFLRASAEVNRSNLGDDYFENAKAVMPDFMYDAEVLNIRIKRIDDGFYPLLDEDKHCYNLFDYTNINDIHTSCNGDADLDKDKPLIIGVDWGSNINCMVVAQQDSDGTEIRIINNLYVKTPKIIDDLIDDEFAPYYKAHKHKVIYFWYDPTGNVSVANSRKTFAEQMQDRLERHGWTVIFMTHTTYNVLHQDKYNLWNELLKNENNKYPDFKINKSNCKELWVSMTTAPAKQGRNESIKKDKASEKKKDLPQEHATHFSDAVDVIIVGMFMDKLFRPIDFIPNTFI